MPRSININMSQMHSDNGNQIKMSKRKKNHFNINASAFETLWRFYAISTDFILWLMHTGSRVGWGGGRSACSQFNLQQCVISTSCFMSRN